MTTIVNEGLSLQNLPQHITTENRSNVFAVIEAGNINERLSPELGLKIDSANVILVSLDGDGVLFSRYDEQGRLQNEFGEWTDPYKERELKVLGVALDKLRLSCEKMGKRLVVALNTNRETDVIQAVFSHFPESVRSNLLASCEGGHVLHSIDKEGKIQVVSLPDQNPALSKIKQELTAELTRQLNSDTQPMGEQAYIPFRQGMITFRGVDPNFVGWDPETKTASGPILVILNKYGYGPDSCFQVAYYPFDGGLDIFFPAYSKLSGAIGIIELATQQGIIQSGEQVFAAHFGDSRSDDISTKGVTSSCVGYDIIDLVVANGKIDLRHKAEVATNSATFWGAYEGVRILEAMVNKKVSEFLNKNTRTLKQLLRSYLAPESPIETDFNLLGVLEKLPLNQIIKLTEMIKTTQENQGTVYCIGNGGSYDNARLMALLLNLAGIKAETPGGGQRKLEVALEYGHDRIFEKILAKKGLKKHDMIITFSGSGNSPNILEAIRLAQDLGAQVFALGGRDGGEMAQMAGRENTLIVPSKTMEVIEDIHAALAYIVSEKIANAGTDLELIREQVQEIINTMALEKNLEGFADTLYEIEKTLVTQGRVIIVGDTVGVNHIRADLGRGATNMLPFALYVPESLGSSNSMSATGNDAGADYVFVHALQNENLQSNDLVIILNSPARLEDAGLELCLDLANAAGSKTIVIGTDLSQPAKVGLGDIHQPQFELATAIMADLFGRTLNEHLKSSFNLKIKPLSLSALADDIKGLVKKKMGRNRMLNRISTLELETKLREVGVLQEGQVITFCYGQMYTVDDPALFGLKRTFY